MSRDTFSRDVWWNVVSLGLAGVCGLAANSLVGLEYGAATLGVFNEVFAIYIVVSQLAVLGVHSSVLYYVAASRDLDEKKAIVTSGLLVALVTSLAMGAVFVAIARPAAWVLGSPGVATGMWWAAPGLVCFALDKVVLAACNGVQRLRAYAIFTAGRMVLMAATIAVCALVGAPGTMLPVALSIGEGLTLLCALITIRDHLGRAPREVMRRWRRMHLHFGARGFVAGLFGELNTRIDVLILGAFASDAIVGAYSFAAVLAEGAYQVLIALRTNYAPIMVRMLAARDDRELLRVLCKARDRVYLGAVVLGVVSAVGYALVIPHLTHDPDLQRSWIYFAILLSGMVAASGYTPFNQLLLWAGRPGWHTVMIVIVVATSAALCTSLVAVWGAVGAATAVAITYAGSVVLLRVMVAKVIDVRV